MDDALRVYDIKMLGREVVSGYETIVFSLEFSDYRKFSVQTDTQIGKPQ